MTPFGKMLRMERLERGMMLGEMARGLGVSSPYLSQIETGKKRLTNSFVERVIDFLELNASEANAMIRAAASSQAAEKTGIFNIEVPDTAQDMDRELAARLALGFARMSPAAKRQLDDLLKGSSNG